MADVMIHHMSSTDPDLIAWNNALKSASAEEPRTLAGHTSFQVRHAVASNPFTPPDALGLLANDSGMSIRILVAGHPPTPAVTLEKLAQDRSLLAAAQVALNPAASPSARRTAFFHVGAQSPSSLSYLSGRLESPDTNSDGVDSRELSLAVRLVSYMRFANGPSLEETVVMLLE